LGRYAGLLLLILVAAGAFAAGIALSGSEPGSGDGGPETGERGVSVSGSRGAAGDVCDELLGSGGNVEVFIARLAPGETGCLREGRHEAPEGATVDVPGVTLTSYPGETATLAGRLWIEQGADGVVIEDLVLDGRNAESLPSPTVNADGVILRGNDISNRNTEICLTVGSGRFGEAAGTLIEGNRIHDCGRLPPTNLDHGIYVSHATDTVIRGNTIYDNADRGVQLYPDAQGTRVVGNVIDGNGEGVHFGGDSDEASSGNVVAGNLIANSNLRYNVESHWQGPVGSGNVVRDNCVWTDRPGFYSGSPAGSGIEAPLDGVRARDNIVEEPDYVDRDAGDFELDHESACARLPVAHR
jgi:parallel beta-helix repeat protein